MVGSNLESIEDDACNEGSVFSVKNLFFNVPARRKFLRGNDTEFRNIIAEFERIALVNSQVSMSLYHNEAEIFNLPVSGLRQRIVNVYGKNLNQKLLSLDAQSSLVTINGFVSRPDATKKRGALQYFFVNGRFMKHPYFHKAIMQAYEQLIPPGEQPSYFVYLTLDPASIDVNIHPTKTEIKFENEQPIWQILMAATREALAKSSAIPTIDFDAEGGLSIPVYNPSKRNASAGGGVSAPKLQVDVDYNPFESEPSAPKHEFDWTKLYEGFERDREAVGQACRQEQPVAPDEPPVRVPVQESLFAEASTANFQYKGRYVLTTMKSGLALIDQHRAHIRILYEQYGRSIRQKQGASQQLLFPEVVEFTPAEAALMPAIGDDLRFVGFDLNDLGGGSYAINGLPIGIEGIDIVQLLKDIVARCVDVGADAQELLCDAIALSLAKATAIPVGKSLTGEEMDHLIASLFSCQDSNLTPDGKTILTMLTDEELDKRFR